MELVKPAFGLIFWMCVSFGIIVFILKKFAWTPILTMLSEREESIQNALDSAEKAKKEMAALQASNEKILNEAKAERDKLMKEVVGANEIHSKILYCEFYILVSCIITIMLGLIDVILIFKISMS